MRQRKSSIDVFLFNCEPQSARLGVEVFEFDVCGE